MPSNNVNKKAINQLLLEPENPGRIFTVLFHILEHKSEKSILLKELFKNIDKNIITPLIAITPRNQIENAFDRYVTPF